MSTSTLSTPRSFRQSAAMLVLNNSISQPPSSPPKIPSTPPAPLNVVTDFNSRPSTSSSSHNPSGRTTTCNSANSSFRGNSSLDFEDKEFEGLFAGPNSPDCDPNNGFNAHLHILRRGGKSNHSSFPSHRSTHRTVSPSLPNPPASPPQQHTSITWCTDSPSCRRSPPATSYSVMAAACANIMRCRSPTDQGYHRYEKPADILKRKMSIDF